MSDSRKLKDERSFEKHDKVTSGRVFARLFLSEKFYRAAGWVAVTFAPAVTLNQMEGAPETVKVLASLGALRAMWNLLGTI